MSTPRPNALIWLWLSAAVFALDLWTKELALAHLELHRPVAVLEGLLNWTLVYNTGASFSLLADAGGWQRWAFSALAVVISAVLAFWLTRTPRRDWRQAVPFALVIGGALGNLVDRIRHGHVIDFIDAYWGEHHWPAFNIADSAIVTGAIGLVLFSLLAPRAGPDAR